MTETQLQRTLISPQVRDRIREMFGDRTITEALEEVFFNPEYGNIEFLKRSLRRLNIKYPAQWLLVFRASRGMCRLFVTPETNFDKLNARIKELLDAPSDQPQPTIKTADRYSLEAVDEFLKECESGGADSEEN